MEKYDVIIVGAGPAGGYCASNLSKIGYNVLLIDKSKKIGEPNFSSGGTVIETIKKFNLPKKVIQSYWKSLYISGPTKYCEVNFKRNMGCVLDYKSLKHHFVSLAKKNGCEVLNGVVVKNVLYNNSNISGVITDSEEKLFGDVVVDATGVSNVLGSKIGITKTQATYYGFGIEYSMKNVDLENNDRLDFYLGRSFVPHGYGWIFPTATNMAKVGVGRFFIRSKTNLIPYLKNLVKNNKQTKEAKIIDLHGGVLCFKPFIKKYSTNNFLVIGDAAGQVNPLGGEGIRHALYSGDFASNVISDCINTGDFTWNKLKNYDMLWKNYIGNKWVYSAIIGRIFYGLINDKLADEFVKYISYMNNEDVFRILFYYKFNAIRRLSGMIKLWMKGLSYSLV